MIHLHVCFLTTGIADSDTHQILTPIMRNRGVYVYSHLNAPSGGSSKAHASTRLTVNRKAVHAAHGITNMPFEWQHRTANSLSNIVNM